MTIDLTVAANELAEAISETLDHERLSALDLLDALASAGLTLAPDEGKDASRAYAIQADLEGLWVRS